jgi:hypothetical protein
MSNGPAPDQSTEPLPRRGADNSGRIPTTYGPGNPVPGQLDAAHYRIRPGAPNLPIPEPQRGDGPHQADGPHRADGPQQADGPRQADAVAERARAAYPIRPGAPGEPAYERFLAMSEHKERLDRRRRRFRWGAGLVALCCLAAVCVTLLTTSSSSSNPSSKKRQAAAPQPTLANPATPPALTPTTAPAGASDVPSTAPVAVSPITLLSSAATDPAPLDPSGLFPGPAFRFDNQSYTRALTTGSGCASAATPSLAAVLARNGCRTVLRATYADGTTAVTVGVAVFDSAAAARAVKQQATGNLLPLTGGGLPSFCRMVVCRLTANAVGRYAYFTVAGYTTGKPVPADDTSAYAAGAAMDQLTFDGLLARARGEANQATAGAATAAASAG